MLIILEGVDGVGKTTFANRLQEHLERRFPGDTVEILHRGPPESDEMLVEYELPLQDYRPGQGHHIICDRWHLGELIYGPILRGGSKMTAARRRHIEMFLESRGALLVHVDAPIDVIHLRRLKRGGPDLLNPAQTQLVHERYTKVFSNVLGHKFYLTPDDKVYQADCHAVEAAARRFENAAAWTNEFPSYVGCTAMNGIILVGERRNPITDNRWTSAFVPTTCSAAHYLLSALPQNFMPKMGMIHLEADNLERLHWMTMAKMVALGGAARAKLEAHGIPHGAVPHPQFMRKYHYNANAEYGFVICETAITGENRLSWQP